MASESCSTSSSSSGDDFVPIFLLRKVTKSFRRIYDKKRSTIRWMKRMQLQLQLKLSSMKTKAIQTWTCVRLLLEWGRHSGVSVESASCRDRRQTGTRLLFWSASVWKKFAQRRRTARRSSAVAVDLPVFSSILASFSYVLLDCVDRLFGHDQAPSKMSHPATSEWKSFVFLRLRFFPPSMDRSVTIVCIFSTHFSVEVAEQPPNKRRWHSSFLVKRWKLTPSFRCLSTLLPPKAQRKDRFQPRRPTRLTFSCTLSARLSRLWKGLELSGQ